MLFVYHHFFLWIWVTIWYHILILIELCSQPPPLYCLYKIDYISICYRSNSTIIWYYFIILFLYQLREEGEICIYNCIIAFHNCMITFTGILCFYMSICINIWIYLFLCCKLSISCKVGLLAKNSLNFLLSEIVFIPNFLQDTLNGCRIIG